jgi:DNA invertase Pin-like site-specific DNA recombinase
MKTYGYLRKSTRRDDKQLNSLEIQRDAVLRYCHEQTLFCDEIFTEEASAHKGVRKIWTALVARVEKEFKKHPVNLIITNTSRGSRNDFDLGKIIEMRKKGINVVFLNANYENTATGNFMLRIQGSVDTFHSERLSEEVPKGQKKSMEKGLFPGNSKIGYKNRRTQKNTAREVDPFAAGILAEIFRKIEMGNSPIEVFRWARERGLQNTRGNPIGKSAFYDIIRDPFYIGKMKWCGEIHEGSHAPIISRARFYRVQEILDGKKITRTAQNYLFAGMVFDRENGEKIQRNVSTNKGITYYRTREKGKKHFREDFLEEILAKKLKEFSENEKIIPKIKKFAAEKFDQIFSEHKKARAAAEQKIKKLSDRLKNLQKSMLDEIPRFTDEEYRELREEILKEKENLIKNLSADETLEFREFDETLTTLAELAKTALRNYFFLTRDEKKLFASQFVPNFIVEREKVLLTCESAFSKALNFPSVLNGSPFRPTAEKYIRNFIENFAEIKAAAIEMKKLFA